MRNLVAMAGLVAVIAIGCVPYARIDQPGVDQHDPVMPRVLFGGNSITVSVQPDIEQTLSDTTSWWSHFIATGGWQMFEFRAADDLVLALPQLAPDAAVINIGTNDTAACFQDAGCEATWSAAELDEVWAPYVAASVPCRIAVTTVYEPDGLTAVNDRIALLHGQGVLTHVADWKTHSADHPEWFFDEIGHLRAAGRTAYADFIVAELTQACPVG